MHVIYVIKRPTIMCLAYWRKKKNTKCMAADRTQAKQGMGKIPKPIPAPVRDTPARKLAKALSRMATRQSGFRDQAAHVRKQQAYNDGSVTKDQSGWVSQIDSLLSLFVRVSFVTVELQR